VTHAEKVIKLIVGTRMPWIRKRWKKKIFLWVL